MRIICGLENGEQQLRQRTQHDRDPRFREAEKSESLSFLLLIFRNKVSSHLSISLFAWSKKKVKDVDEVKV